MERELVEAQQQSCARTPVSWSVRVDERTARALQKSVSENCEAFSYSLTHDLRAPLRAIQSYLQIFLEDEGGKVAPEAVQLIENAIAGAQRLDGMVLDLLAFTRLSHEAMPVQPVDIEKLVAVICQDRPDCRPPKAELIIQSPLPQVMGNKVSLVQCLTNLLDNAVKFMASGVKPKVRIYAEDEGAMVRLVVEDNGIGIKTTEQDALFRMFHRLHGKEYPGTGIGLAIVRKAAERMGGSAGFDSQPGRGSRFWVQLVKAKS